MKFKLTKSDFRRFVVEFIGTFFLVFVIATTQNPFAIGITLGLMIYAFGHISGGHFNPAVTVALMLNKSTRKFHAVFYILFQILGALAAALLFNAIAGSPYVIAPSDKLPLGVSFVLEALFTFALVTVIFNVAVNEKSKNNQFYGLAIGLTIFIAATSAGAVSGGAFNPAVGSTLLLDIQNIGKNLVNLAIYFVAPISGAVIAFGLNKFLND